VFGAASRSAEPQGCEGTDMSSHKDVVSRATAALAQSVASIIGCDDDEVTKRAALAETFDEFESYLDRHVGGDIVEKADRGAHDLAGALLRHLTDRLEAKRERHGYTKADTATKDHTMNRTEELRAIAKNYGVVRLAKLLVADGDSHGIGEPELVELIGNHDRRDGETAAKCFARQYEANTDDGLALRKAINIAKQSVISGADLRDAADADQAWDQLAELGKKMAPTATPEKQFALAFSANPLLAARAHRRPSPTTFFPPPR
jgi:hypothetical protein